jgi:ribosomal protein S4
LQTQVYLKGLANTPKQARQFIIHGHISVQGRKVTIPGYLVKDNEEGSIEYNQYSSLTNELHPMRPKPKIDIAVGDSQVSRLISIGSSSGEKESDDSEQPTDKKPAKKSKDSKTKTESPSKVEPEPASEPVPEAGSETSEPKTTTGEDEKTEPQTAEGEQK